tara:strand:+ start:3138 stop:3686 length:549 start_codon:yes stop_codon:yes gene_type:complete
MFKKEKYFYLDSIQDLDLDYIKKTKAKLIIRDKKKINFSDYSKFINKCKSKRIEVFIANNTKLLFDLNLNKFYISSKNKKKYLFLRNINKKIDIIGSAHSFSEIIEKRDQGCSKIILSRLFKTDKPGFLDIVKFNKITLNSKLKYIALGGINKNNYKKIKMVNCIGIAMMKELSNKPIFLRE